jgi:hypothetical protein
MTSTRRLAAILTVDLAGCSPLRGAGNSLMKRFSVARDEVIE